jgi:hypothetical protein
LGKTFSIVGVIITSQATVDGLSEQRDQVVSDIPVGTTFLEIVRGNVGKAQGIIQLWTAGIPPSEVMVIPRNSRLTFGLNWIQRSEDLPKGSPDRVAKSARSLSLKRKTCATTSDSALFRIVMERQCPRPRQLEGITRQLTASRG